MTIKYFTQSNQLKADPIFPAFTAFVGQAPNAHFFQSPEFLEFIEPVKGYRPVLLVALGDAGEVVGSLLGAFQMDGGKVKSWLSRRLIVWGGPLGGEAAARKLLEALKKTAAGKAIYVEFRNYFDTAPLRDAFAESGFTFKPHLNFLVTLDGEDAVQKRMSSNRRRQIRSSLAAGAEVGEPQSEGEVLELYNLLHSLYREKVKKPLPSFDLFRSFWTSPNGKIFLVKYEGKVIGGSAGPIYRGNVVYQWYVCGDNTHKGIHASVLATWAQIEYGLNNGYQLFDFMGAGKPEEEYGVREFKARFGGEEVCFGRYEMILNPLLYRIGKLGLKIYHKIK